jgi:hypothetical protein
VGRTISRQCAWRVLRRLNTRFLKPRPRHVQADLVAQTACKTRLRPLLRQVATAFPHCSVELWAVDEHRIGLKPLLQKVSCVDHQRPLAPVQHRYDWRYLVGFVHPSSGQTTFHLATSVSIPLFEVELAAFATAVGATPPGKSCSCWIGRAGTVPSAYKCQTTARPLPDHIHLLFLPPYSPELEPAEHLWPLTNTVWGKRHFASIEELEDAQALRCVALQGQPALVRSTACFSWWPRQIHPRRGSHAQQAH